MLSVSSSARTAIASNGRTFKARITAGGNTIDSDIKKMTFTYGSCGAEAFGFGSVFLSYVDIILSGLDIMLADKEMYVEVGIVLPNGNVEYIPMGYFTAGNSDIKKARSQVSIKASDRLAKEGTYIPTVTFPETIKAVMDDLSTQMGVAIITQLDTSGTIEKSMESGSYQSVLGVLSGLLGGFCYCDRSGNIVIAAHPTTTVSTVREERCFSPVETGEEQYSISSLTVVATPGGEDPVGDTVEEISFSEGYGVGISVENAYMTQALFDEMKSRICGYSFDSCKARFMGDPTIEQCDAIEVVNYEGRSFFVPCMSLIHEFDGGFTTEIATPARSSSDSSSKGPLQQAVESLRIALLAVDKLLAKKIVAERIDVDNLFSQAITATNLTITDLSRFLSKSKDTQVLIQNGKIAIENLLNIAGTSEERDYLQRTEMDYNGLKLIGEALSDDVDTSKLISLVPRILMILEGKNIGQLNDKGLVGFSNDVSEGNYFPFAGITELRGGFRSESFFPYDCYKIGISINNAGTGYTVARASDKQKYTRHNHMSKLVDFREKLTISVSSAISSGKKLVLGTIESGYEPLCITALAVYMDSTSSIMFTAAINTNGEIIVRPMQALTAGSEYTLYLSAMYSVGRLASNPNAPVYTIDYALNNCTSSNNATSIKEGESYTTVITPAQGSTINFAGVAMGDDNEDITDSVATKQADGTILIYIENVTGNIAIIYSAKLPIKITSYTVPTEVTRGETFICSVEAVSNIDAELSYQWYYSNKSSSGGYGAFYLANSGTAATWERTIGAASTITGQKVYCLITDSEGNTLETDVVEIIINDAISGVKITQQPEDVEITVNPGGNTGQTGTSIFYVEAEGDGLSFQWQSNSGSSDEWKNISTSYSWVTVTNTETSSEYKNTMTTIGANGYKYRCVITDENGNVATSREALLTVLSTN